MELLDICLHIFLLPPRQLESRRTIRLPSDHLDVII
jgi:hypothetical protein